MPECPKGGQHKRGSGSCCFACGQMMHSEMPDVTIESGETFIVAFPDGPKFTLTHGQWMALRKVQNILIYTEPI